MSQILKMELICWKHCLKKSNKFFSSVRTENEKQILKHSKLKYLKGGSAPVSWICDGPKWFQNHKILLEILHKMCPSH